MIRDEKPLRLIVSVVFCLKDNNKEQDILLICVVNTEDEETADSNQVSNKELALLLLDVAYKLLTEETLSINLMNAKTGLIDVLTQNYLL